MTELSWNVVGVFDPDGAHDSFAYTRGLHAGHGVTEVRAGSLPVAGNIDGWHLSLDDLGRLLNNVADDLIAGRRTLGDRWSEELDGGFTHVDYHLDADTAEAPARGTHQLPAGTPVAVLTYTVEQVVGDVDRWPVSAAAAKAADLLGLVRADAEMADMFLESDADACPVDGVGPYAELLGEISAVVTGATSSLWGWLVVGTVGARRAFPYALGSAQAAQRASGREAWGVTASGLAARDAELVLAHVDDGEDAEFSAALAEMVGTWLHAAYNTLIVADVVDATTAAYGTGWLLAICAPEHATRLWLAHHQLDGQAGTLDEADDNILGDLVIASARSASDGHGAPLCTAPELAASVFTPAS